MSDHFFVWKEILEKWNKGNISDYSAYQILNEEYINLTEFEKKMLLWDTLLGKMGLKPTNIRVVLNCRTNNGRPPVLDNLGFRVFIGY